MSRPVALITPAEMAEIDRRSAAAGTPGAVLMDRAGRAVADRAEHLLARSGGRRILVLCGPGNNGGDGFVAATLLAARGHAVSVAALASVAALRGDAASAAAGWRGPVSDAADTEIRDHDIVIDALFGAGLSRPLDGAALALVRRVGEAGRPVLAVDLPSGLGGLSGAVLGGDAGAALRADETVTFVRLKPGHLLMPGREFCGAISLADIGVDPALVDAAGSTLSHNLPELWWRHLPRPSAAGHKYSRGHLVVVSGPMPTLGASRLSARAGLRVGAGLVTLATPESGLAAHAAQLTAVMLKPIPDPGGLGAILADARLNAVVLGPGLGHHAGTPAVVAAALAPSAKPRAAVLDADALTLFAGRADALAEAVRGASGPVVVTPHDGEFARLFEGCDEVLSAPDKVARARAGARRLGAVMVLKGPDTVVAAPDGRAALAGEDAPWLATAGSGDVLSGMVGGLLAQSVPAFEAAAAAVWMHAEAARCFGPGLISEDLPDALPQVLRALLARPDLNPPRTTP